MVSSLKGESNRLADEIGIAFSKTGGSASALGVQFEKVASWIAIISSKTRESAESIGHSINTILSRMANITAKGFDEEDGTKINDVAKALAQIDVQLTDSYGNFRDFGKVMDEIGSKWGNLDSRTRSYLATTIAGVRQQSRFYNLMNGYSESVELYDEALKSAGTTQEKFNIYLESNQATLDKLKSTAQGLWLNFWDNDGLMNVIKGFTHFIQTLDNLVQKIGSLGTVFSLLIPIIAVKFVFAVQKAYINTIKLGLAFSNVGPVTFATQLKIAASQALGLSVATDKAVVSVGKLKLISTGVVAGISLLVTGLFMWANHANKAKQETEELLETLKKQRESHQSMNELVESYKELSEQTDLTTEEQQKLLEVKEKIVDLIPKASSVIDNENLSLEEQLKLLKNLNDEELRRAKKQAGDAVARYGDSYEMAKSAVENLKKRIEENQKIIDELNLKQAQGAEWTKEEIIAYKEASDNLDRYSRSLSENKAIVDAYENGKAILTDTTKENTESIKEEKEFVEELITSQTALANSTSILKNEIKDLAGTLTDLEEMQDKVADGYSYSYEEIEKIREKYPELESAIYRTAKGWGIEQSAIENLRKSQIEQRRTQIQSQLDMSQTALDQSKARISNIVKEIESVKNLADAYKLAAQLGKEMGVSVAESSIAGLVGGTNSYEEYLKGKGVDILSAITNRLPDGVLTKGQYDNLKKQQKEVVEYGKQLDDYNKLAEDTQKKLNDLINGRVSGGSKDRDKKEKDKYTALADATLKYRNAIEEVNNQLSILKSKQNLETDDLNKITLLQKQNELLKQQQVNYHNLANAQRQERDSLVQSLSKQGFKFAGEGDNKIITNLENIKGKSKEVEEQFKKFIDLQTKEIPSASQQWWGLEDSIKSVIVEMEKLEVGNLFKTSTKGIESLNKEFEMLDFRLNLLDENETGQKFDLMSQKIQKAEFQVRFLSDELQRLKAVGFEGSIEAVEEYNKQLEDLEKKHMDAQLFLKSLTDSYDSDYKKIMSEREKIADDTINVIKKAYQKQRELVINSLNQELRAEENAHKRRIERLDEQLNKYEEIIKAQLDSIDRQEDEDSFNKDLSKVQEERAEIVRQISVLSMDDSLEARARVSELNKQLAEQDERIEEMKHNRTIDLRKQNLNDQLNAYKKDIEEKKNAEDAKYERIKLRIEQEIQLEEWKYDKLINDEQYYADLRQEIIDGNLENVQESLQGFLDEFDNYNKRTVQGIESSWQSLLNMIREIELAQDGLGKMPSGGKGSSGISYGGSGGSSSRGLNLGKGAATGEDARKNDEKLKNDPKFLESELRRTQEVINDRKKAGLDTSLQEDYLKKIITGSYAEGGKITHTGLAMVHGSANKPEYVFNYDQFKDLAKFVANYQPKITTPKIPEISRAVEIRFDNLINIEGNATKDTIPALNKAGNNILENLQKQLIKNGVQRGVKL